MEKSVVCDGVDQVRSVDRLSSSSLEIRSVLPIELPKDRQDLLTALYSGDIRESLGLSSKLEDEPLSFVLNKVLKKIDGEKVNADFLRTEPFTTLMSDKSYEANPYWPSIKKQFERLDKLHNLSDKSGQVIGLVVYGSIAKGYWDYRDGSDVDGRLITLGNTDEELSAVAKVRETLFSLFPGERDVDHCAYSHEIESTASLGGKYGWISSGIFMGNYERFRELQRDYIEKIKIDPKGDSLWKSNQLFMARNGVIFDKLFGRWGDKWKNKYGNLEINNDQKLLLNAVTAVQKTPLGLDRIA